MEFGVLLFFLIAIKFQLFGTFKWGICWLVMTLKDRKFDFHQLIVLLSNFLILWYGLNIIINFLMSSWICSTSMLYIHYVSVSLVFPSLLNKNLLSSLNLKIHPLSPDLYSILMTFWYMFYPDSKTNNNISDDDNNYDNDI